MGEFEVRPVVATEPVSPELALIDPGLRQRALILEELARIDDRRTLLAQPLVVPFREITLPAARVSVSAVVLYAAVRLIEVLAFGTLIALALAVLVAVVY